MGSRDHSCETCGRGGMNDDRPCICVPLTDAELVWLGRWADDSMSGNIALRAIKEIREHRTRAAPAGLTQEERTAICFARDMLAKHYGAVTPVAHINAVLVRDAHLASTAPAPASGPPTRDDFHAGHDAGYARLLPCPFCGGEAALDEFKGRRNSVACDGPDCFASMDGPSCVESWNRRSLADRPEPPAVMTVASEPSIASAALDLAEELLRLADVRNGYEGRIAELRAAIPRGVDQIEHDAFMRGVESGKYQSRNAVAPESPPLTVAQALVTARVGGDFDWIEFQRDNRPTRLALWKRVAGPVNIQLDILDDDGKWGTEDLFFHPNHAELSSPCTLIPATPPPDSTRPAGGR